jgi:hypothetical protein
MNWHDTLNNNVGPELRYLKGGSGGGGGGGGAAAVVVPIHPLAVAVIHLEEGITMVQIVVEEDLARHQHGYGLS